MKISILASGSKGNVSYLETNQNHILIDCGMNNKYIENKLNDLKVDSSKINAIFLTHTHDDHIMGLRVFLKKHKATVFLSQKMYKYLKGLLVLEDYYILEEEITINDLTVTPIRMSHDSDDIYAYLFKQDQKELAYITDTGYINVKNFEYFTNKNMYVIESNHDIKMLMNGPYPHHLKQRILSDKGHLSNIDSANYLTKFVGTKTKTIVLIHLSETNNNKDEALTTLKSEFDKHKIKFQNIIMSSQNEQTELIEID